jgi:hypothetical protein
VQRGGTLAPPRKSEAVGMALGGAALAVAAVWLPYYDAESLRRAWPRTSNLHDPESLWVGGGGWLFIAVAISCAVSILIAYVRRRETWGPWFAGIVLILLATLAGVAAVSTSTFGVAQLDNPDPGLGIYAEGAAGFLMLVGGGQILRPRNPMIAMSQVLVVVGGVCIVRLLLS